MDFKGGFIKNLPKIYGLYTGGFAVFIILMAVAEQAGVSAKMAVPCRGKWLTDQGQPEATG